MTTETKALVDAVRDLVASDGFMRRDGTRQDYAGARYVDAHDRLTAALARVDERPAVEWATDGSRSMGRMGERTAFVRLDEVSCPSSPWRWRIVQGDGDDVFASGWEASETDAKAAAERAAGLRGER